MVEGLTSFGGARCFGRFSEISGSVAAHIARACSAFQSRSRRGSTANTHTLVYRDGAKQHSVIIILHLQAYFSV
jgi:hypothetical protein